MHYAYHTSIGCKSQRVSQLETLVKDKGVVREDKSEGSRRQNRERTNRNTIQAYLILTAVHVSTYGGVRGWKILS